MSNSFYTFYNTQTGDDVGKGTITIFKQSSKQNSNEPNQAIIHRLYGANVAHW